MKRATVLVTMKETDKLSKVPSIDYDILLSRILELVLICSLNSMLYKNQNTKQGLYGEICENIHRKPLTSPAYSMTL